MKIIFVVTSLGRGGADRQVIELAKYHSSMGHRVMILSMLELGDMGISAINSGLNVKSLVMKRGKLDIFALMRLKSFIDSFKPDFIHSHMKHAILLCRASKALGLSKKPLVETYHNICTDNESLSLVLRLSKNLPKKTTFVSAASMESYEKNGLISKSKSVVIPNAITYEYLEEKHAMIDEMSKKPNENYVIGALGRIHDVKNYPLLIKAFSLFNNKYGNTSLVIAGHGDTKKLCELAKKLGVEDKVIFLGAVDDISAFFDTIDLYVVTSKREGFCLSLAEAILNLKPYVSTNSGGVMDIVIDDSFISNDHSDVAICSLMEKNYRLSTQQIEELTSRNREYVERMFGIDKVCNKWMSVYNEL